MGLIQIGLLFKCFSNAFQMQNRHIRLHIRLLPLKNLKSKQKKTDYIRILPVRYFRLSREKHAKIFGLYYKPIYICTILNHPQKNI